MAPALDPQFGKEVRAARQARQWSQSVLALKVYPDRIPHPTAISKIENGMTVVDPKVRKKLIRILGLKG